MPSFALALALVTLGLLVTPAVADDRAPVTAGQILALYGRLSPGMTAGDVAALARRPRLAASEAVTSWVLWSVPQAGAETAVLRGTYRDGRLFRLEYEAFGDEYRRLAKGGDDGIELAEEELRHLWQRGQAADSCQVALEAFHRLLLRAQDRLVPSEQEAWVKALELRRQVESHAPGPSR
jgi:hypothetical protein